jgi:hypothetical protein
VLSGRGLAYLRPWVWCPPTSQKNFFLIILDLFSKGEAERLFGHPLKCFHEEATEYHHLHREQEIRAKLQTLESVIEDSKCLYFLEIV